MAPSQTSRKLRAILSADVVGYGLLMADNELATIATLKSHKEIIASVIQSHYGRVVDSPGDNLLAEFQSVVDAVQCAVEIQKDLQEKNEQLPPARRMSFRIGVNLGDIVQDGDLIYGDGVNIAARIESLAGPGGVSISGTAFDHVRTKLDYGYRYAGEQQVKNIANPVRIYNVLTEPEYKRKVIGEKRFLGKLSRKVAIAVIVALAVISGSLASYYIYLYRSGKIETDSMKKTVFPQPDKPSIAILPFVNLAEDPKQQYFCDGMSEQIMTGLSQGPYLYVTSRNSSFAYRD